ncbi:hypothetical protein C8R44DRAFT_875382 [Mycena epipterygia]|nr:hypothetical protein C8R44DRAFT_875382 [Mycena epipterygia]
MLCLTLLASLATANAYSWPSPQLDALEAARFNQFILSRGPVEVSGFAGFINPCDEFPFVVDVGTGRSNAANWIRTLLLLKITSGLTREKWSPSCAALAVLGGLGA